MLGDNIKEKQIEEMALTGVDMLANDINQHCANLKENYCGDTHCTACLANALYNAGYRKQSEVITVKKNKYGGILDCEIMDKRIYDLWYQMLRRCYDEEQQKRGKGKCYIGCTVCDRWMSLSNFAKDIRTLDGYENWRDKVGYCLDKDTRVDGNKVYSRETCCFIPYTENIREMNKRNPHVHSNHKTEYILFNDKEKIYFKTEKDACAFLGVKPCTVSSSYRYGCKCKGYSIAKMKGGAE